MPWKILYFHAKSPYKNNTCLVHLSVSMNRDIVATKASAFWSFFHSLIRRQFVSLLGTLCPFRWILWRTKSNDGFYFQTLLSSFKDRLNACWFYTTRLLDKWEHENSPAVHAKAMSSVCDSKKVLNGLPLIHDQSSPNYMYFLGNICHSA